MNLLAKDHISLIESDVENARITLSNLSDELVDHICCEVEQMMYNGKSFEEAYSILKDQTGIKVLQQIQENTLYLIDKKYRLMKTTMKITGNVSLALLALGTLFKIFHWPGAGPMLVVGFALLCFFFFPAAVYTNNKEGGSKGNPSLNGSILIGGILLMMGILFKVMHWPWAGPLLVLGWFLILFVFLPVLLYIKIKEATTAGEKRIFILGVIALIVFAASTLFKMMHWPGAGPLMIIGSLALVGIFLPLYTNMRYKMGELRTGQFIYIITLTMYAVVLTSLIAMNVSKDILGIFVSEQSNATAINRYFEKKNAKLAAMPLDSSYVKQAEKIQQVQKGAALVKSYIQDMKLKLVQEIEQLDRASALEAISEPQRLERKDNYDMVRHILLQPEGGSLGTNLRAKIKSFRELVMPLTSTDKELSESIFVLVDTPSETENGETYDWELFLLAGAPQITALGILSRLEKNINQVESATIQHLQKHI
jgi:hypothetical protein